MIGEGDTSRQRQPDLSFPSGHQLVYAATRVGQHTYMPRAQAYSYTHLAACGLCCWCEQEVVHATREASGLQARCEEAAEGVEHGPTHLITIQLLQTIIVI